MSYPFSGVPGMTPTPPNFAYGYEEPPACQPPLTETQSSSVVEDITRGVIGVQKCKMTSQGKSKLSTTDVCPSFCIMKLYILYLCGEPGPIGCSVEYSSQGNDWCDFLPADAIGSRKYHKHLHGIPKYPAASNSDLDAVFGWKLDKYPSRTSLTLYDRQGFFLSSDGTMAFAQPLRVQGLPPKFVSKSLQKRRQYPLAPWADDPERIVSAFWRICFQDPILKFVGLYTTASLFLAVIPPEQRKELAFLNLVIQDKAVEEKVIAMINTNDLTRYAVPELGMGAKALETELNDVFDGVAVVVDHCFADEETAIHEGTKAIIRASRAGRKLVVSISEKVGGAANQLEEGCCISVPLQCDLGGTDARSLRVLSAKYETVLIDCILRNQPVLQQCFHNVEATRFQDAEIEALPPPVVHTINLLTAVAGACSSMLHVDILSNDELCKFVVALCKSLDLNQSSDEIICVEFSRLLSEKLRNGEFSFVPKKNRLMLDPSGGQVIVYGERLYLSQKLMNAVLTVMQTTMNKRSLVNALKRSGALNATDGNTHPLDAHDITGAPVRLYCYDVSAHILDADVRELMQEPESAKFFMSPEQLPDRVFLPLVSRSDGRIAGRQIRYCDATNNNIAIWGQSGVGKSFLMMQLMKRAASMGHRVIVFDSSDSFSADVLRQELSSDFVDAHVAIYELDELEIPVDLFRIDRTKSRSAQGTMLLGSICAGIPELSPQQKQLLRKTLNDVLEEVSPNEPIRPKDICTMLDKESPAYKGLLTKLEPLFYTIEQLGMADRSWKAFFTKEITVIRMNASFTEHGNALFDMLTASLYNAQCEDPSTALDVFIDELQNQNLSRGSAIHKILTEGRKKNTSFCGATQDYYPHNTELGSTMGKADTQIFFKPTFNSVEQVAKELRFGKADRERLDNMTRGVCFIKGSVYNPEIGQNEPTIISGIVKAL